MDLKIQQRSVIRYYCLREKSNKQIREKLKQAYPRDAFTLRAVEKWAARFRSGQTTVKDEPRSGRPADTDFGDAVRRLLEEQPRASSRDISKALCSPRTTVLRVLRELGLQFFSARWVPHRLTDEQKHMRVEISQEILDMINRLGPRQRDYLITGDESWMYWDNNIRGMWAEDRADVPMNAKRTVSSKKTMVSVYFSRQGIISIEFLPRKQKYNSLFFTETILPSIEDKLAERRPELRARGAHLHIDNAKPHTARRSTEEIRRMGINQVPQPPYSPDLAPCDFFLFGYLKNRLEGQQFLNEEAVVDAVTAILETIPIELFSRAMEEWVRRLTQCIELGGEYLI
jgi:histone-lysine N-methyltransferase SETMAR